MWATLYFDSNNLENPAWLLCWTNIISPVVTLRELEHVAWNMVIHTVMMLCALAYIGNSWRILLSILFCTGIIFTYATVIVSTLRALGDRLCVSIEETSVDVQKQTNHF
jgi:hypothetical protein